jgi:hypothetical protein
MSTVAWPRFELGASKYKSRALPLQQPAQLNTVPWNGTANDELETMWNVTVVAHFKIPSQYLPGSTEVS